MADYQSCLLQALDRARRERESLHHTPLSGQQVCGKTCDKMGPVMKRRGTVCTETRACSACEFLLSACAGQQGYICGRTDKGMGPLMKWRRDVPGTETQCHFFLWVRTRSRSLPRRASSVAA